MSIAVPPAQWQEILSACPEGAIIAGGAVRDLLLGVAPKDIDVFFPTKNIIGIFPPEGFASLDSHERPDEYNALTMIDVVVRGSFGGTRVDLVGIHAEGHDWNGAWLVSTFDFGITRSWSDGVAIFDTEEAKFDREKKFVTRILSDRPERALTRFERFNERMGGVYSYKVGA